MSQNVKRRHLGPEETTKDQSHEIRKKVLLDDSASQDVTDA